MSSATVYSLIKSRYLIHTPWAKFWSHYNNCLRETHDSRLKSSKAPFNGEHMDWREYRGTYRGTSLTSFPGFSLTRPYGARVGERTWGRGWNLPSGVGKKKVPHPTPLFWVPTNLTKTSYVRYINHLFKSLVNWLIHPGTAMYKSFAIQIQ